MVSPRSFLRINVRTVLSVLTALVVGVVIVAPLFPRVSYAASYKYADDISTAEFQVRDSGIASSITGGRMRVILGIAVTQNIITYYPAPGYQEVMRASGQAPMDVYMSHERAYYARSQCYWGFGGVGGTASVNCWRYY